MLQALPSYALNPLLPSSDSSVIVRPAVCSSDRSVSMSLPRYHHVEIPIPAPTVPNIEFSCQKHPASLTTDLVNFTGPTAAAMSASVTPLQSPLRNPAPAVAAAGADGWAPSSA